MRTRIVELARSDRRRQGQHAGLLLQRFLSKDVIGDQGNPEERLDLLKAAIEAARSEQVRALYQRAFDRWNASFADGGAHVGRDSRTEGRMIVGLGSENVLEMGIRLDHTYGVPIVPGSALKGLASHYCDCVWGQRGQENPSAENSEFRREGKYHRLLFGDTTDGGVIAFHDAWIRPECLASEGLTLDVMTPHHKDWQTVKAPPTDFDDPRPLAFLSVRGTFLVRVSWVGPPNYPQADKWTNLAMQLLLEALAQWGIGGKTSSGYGRMVEGAALTARAIAGDRGGGGANLPPPTRPTKRSSGTPTRVRIVGSREKGGFDVQEKGRPQGTLTVGTKPEGVTASPGDEVAVEVHNDDSNRPQYRWPSPAAAKNRSEQRQPRR